MLNNNTPELWKNDSHRSVDFYNEWFLNFAPEAYRKARFKAIEKVENTFKQTKNLAKISIKALLEHPEMISSLRMSAAPPLARDRLIGLAGIPKSLIHKMECGALPTKMNKPELINNLEKISTLLNRLIDLDIFPWLENGQEPTKDEIHRAASIVADRECGAMADPIIRNEQEHRQLSAISQFLTNSGYTEIKPSDYPDIASLPNGTFSFHHNVSVPINHINTVNIPVDVVVKKMHSSPNELPILIECKSAGDFTNTNKRRKEEAVKMMQLKEKYGDKVVFILFLCGYFDTSYLGYEAAEGIDWIWEHRIEDILKLGI